MKEKNEKMKRDWQDEGGKIKERQTVCEQYKKKEISQSEIFEKQFFKTQLCKL